MTSLPASDPRKQQDIPLVYGYLEHLEEEGGDLIATGWLLRLDGPFDRFQVQLAGGETLSAEVHARPDLTHAIPHVPAAERGGFRARVPLPNLGQKDAYEFTVVGLIEGRPAGCLHVGYHRSREPQTFPPRELLHRASGNERGFWRATGIKACHDLRRTLAPHLDLDGVRRILDWGCASGRVTTHLIDRFPRAEVFGTDIDNEAVEWASHHLRGHFSPCGKNPPLPYRDSSFDLVVALSVFSHLTRAYQSRWLEELRRVTVDGGIVFATTHGEFAARWAFPSPGECEQKLSTGFSDEIRDDNLGPVASGEYYRATFQTRENTREFWGRFFDVVDFVEGGMNNFQDVYVLRNSPRSSSS